MLRTRNQIRNSVPTGTELKYSVPLASGVNCKCSLKIKTGYNHFGDRSKGQGKNLIRTKTNMVLRIYPAGLYI